MVTFEYGPEKYTVGIRTRVRTAVGPLFEVLHIYVTPNLRTGRVCKLGSSLQTRKLLNTVCKPARSAASFANQMYCLQTHETHYFSLLRTDSVCKLNAIVCRFKCAHYIVFANQSSLQTAQHSAGTKKRLPSCARAGEGGPMGIRRRSWEIMGDTGQGGNQRIDRGDRDRSREIKLRSGEVDRG